MHRYFLKLLHQYCFLLGILLVSCNSPDSSGSHTLYHKRVIVFDSSEHTRSKPSPVSKLTDTSYLELVFKQYDLVNVQTLDSTIRVDLKYADTSNFLKMNLYDGLRHAYLNCETATRLANAQFFLKNEHPEYSLIVFDAARPLHIQQLMWDSLKMHPDLKFNYLAPPYQNSLHNYGCAIDLSIMNIATGELLDMGTPYDFFGKLAQPINEMIYLKSGLLSKEAYDNRILLRQVMQRAQLNPINSEWWHFSMCTKEEAVKKFKLIQ